MSHNPYQNAFVWEEGKERIKESFDSHPPKCAMYRIHWGIDELASRISLFGMFCTFYFFGRSQFNDAGCLSRKIRCIHWWTIQSSWSYSSPASSAIIFLLKISSYTAVWIKKLALILTVCKTSHFVSFIAHQFLTKHQIALSLTEWRQTQFRKAPRVIHSEVQTIAHESTHESITKECLRNAYFETRYHKLCEFPCCLLVFHP